MVRPKYETISTQVAMLSWMLIFGLLRPIIALPDTFLVSGQPQDADQDAAEKRNFLRFGKKSLPASYGDESADSSNEMFRGLNRRDYREFVRFGKRSVIPALQGTEDDTNYSDEVEVAPASQSWLPILRSLQLNKKDLEPAMPSDNRRVAEKRRDDFLRFGKKWSYHNKLMKAKLLCQSRGINCNHLLKAEAGDPDEHQAGSSEKMPTLNDLLLLDSLLNGRLGKKSNDFLRFG